jgi:amino acid transporter
MYGLRYTLCAYSSRILNILTVRYYGVSEFYLSVFKIVLMMGLIVYTFITMVGGSPDRDPYGFRYWKNPVCLTDNTPICI